MPPIVNYYLGQDTRNVVDGSRNWTETKFAVHLLQFHGESFEKVGPLRSNARDQAASSGMGEAQTVTGVSLT
jgi:hypothetical protein